LWTRRSRPTCVDRQNRRDLPTLLANGDLHTELRTRIDARMASRLQDGGVQKNVARTVCEFYEPEAFSGIEPLDDTVDGWPGRGRLFAPRISRSLRRRLTPARFRMIVVVEVAPAASVASLFSHSECSP